MSSRTRDTTRCSTLDGWIGLAGVAMLGLVLSGPVARAAEGPPTFAMERVQVRQYLASKYRLDELSVRDDEDHIRGSIRHLVMAGTIQPARARGRVVGTIDDARAIAQAFFAEEADLSGLTEKSEMRELVPKHGRGSYVDQRGSVNLRYDHYIGGVRLEESVALMGINAKGEIESLIVHAVPPSAALLRAVGESGLSEKQIRIVVRNELKAMGVDPRTVEVLELEKVAIAAPPHVIWYARVGWDANSWLFTIDAFTGALLDSHSEIRTVR